MSSPPSPIDDGTPMNVHCAPPRTNRPPPAPELNGQPDQRPERHPLGSDDNPDNIYPESSHRRSDHSHPPSNSAAAPPNPPASPMQFDGADDPSDVNGDDGAVAGAIAGAVAGAVAGPSYDDPDALPKLFRSSVANPAVGPSAVAGDAELGKRTKTSVEAWSATDVYALPPSYPSMGKFVIISNKSFDSSTGMGVRNGTDVDAENLYLRFKEFGFDVEVRRNLKAKDMKDLFQRFAQMDHSSCAAFGCAILTHGEDGVIYGTDRSIDIDQITKPFKGDRCKSLVGKPKVFFIQACRGTDLMDGVGVDLHQMDSNADIAERLPVESDFLMAYSVVPGYFSWRNSIRGSWFIQALCDSLDRYGRSMDLLKLMTRVNKKVALDFESNTNNREMHRKKQIPCITSMLTKDFFLDPRAIPLDGSP